PEGVVSGARPPGAAGATDVRGRTTARAARTPVGGGRDPERGADPFAADMGSLGTAVGATAFVTRLRARGSASGASSALGGGGTEVSLRGTGIGTGPREHGPILGGEVPR